MRLVCRLGWRHFCAGGPDCWERLSKWSFSVRCLAVESLAVFSAKSVGFASWGIAGVWVGRWGALISLVVLSGCKASTAATGAGLTGEVIWWVLLNRGYPTLATSLWSVSVSALWCKCTALEALGLLAWPSRVCCPGWRDLFCEELAIVRLLPMIGVLRPSVLSLLCCESLAESCVLSFSGSIAVASHSMDTSSQCSRVASWWCVSWCFRWLVSSACAGNISTSLSGCVFGAHLVCLDLRGGQ